MMISTEKGVVGEFDAQIEMDLGTFGGSEVPADPVEEITQKISSKPFFKPSSFTGLYFNRSLAK